MIRETYKQSQHVHEDDDDATIILRVYDLREAILRALETKPLRGKGRAQLKDRTAQFEKLIRKPAVIHLIRVAFGDTDDEGVQHSVLPDLEEVLSLAQKRVAT